MDGIFLMKYLINKNKEETKQEDSFATQTSTNQSFGLYAGLYMLFMFAVFIWMIISPAWAAGISWKCNASASFGARLMYAILSSWFATTYIVLRQLNYFCPQMNIYD